MGNPLPRRVARDLVNGRSAYDAINDILMSLRPDYHTVMTNFLGDALPSEWASAKTNGTAAAVTVASSQLTCTAGTDDNGYAGQGFGLFWKGDNGIYFQSIQALDTITSSKIEVGLTDAVDDAGAVNAKTTPTATADDFCVVVRDTDHNTSFDLISGLDATPASNATGIYTLAAATNFNVEMRSMVDSVSVFINNALVGAGSMQGGDLTTPWVFCQARAGSASRILTVEWWFCTGPNGVSAPY